MAIPTAALTAIKDLLRITDSGRDNHIQQVWERVLATVCRESDWFCEREDISAWTSAHTYTTTSRAVRILALLHNRVQLYKTTARQMDYMRNTWQTDSAGTPEFWWQDKIPTLDGVGQFTAETFGVHPAPSSNATGSSGFYAYASMVPTDDDPTPTWIDPYLIYKTAALFLLESAEERLDETDTATAQFYDRLAGLWWQVLKRRIP